MHYPTVACCFACVHTLQPCCMYCQIVPLRARSTLISSGLSWGHWGLYVATGATRPLFVLSAHASSIHHHAELSWCCLSSHPSSLDAHSCKVLGGNLCLGEGMCWCMYLDLLGYDQAGICICPPAMDIVGWARPHVHHSFRCDHNLCTLVIRKQSLSDTMSRDKNDRLLTSNFSHISTTTMVET